MTMSEISPALASLSAAPPAPGSGVFVVFEGIDGCGKTTQIELLAARIKAANRPVTLTFEPGGSDLGTELRRILLHHDGPVDPRAEALLYAADRAHHAATVIRPALAAGRVVISDRYWDSSIAYQGAGRALGEADIAALSHWATNTLTPSLTILLDLPIEAAAARLGSELDRLESEAASFHQAVREKFLDLAKRGSKQGRNYLVLDATASIEALSAQVWARVEPLLANLPEAARG